MDANTRIRQNREMLKAKRNRRSEMRMMYAKAVVRQRGELSDIKLPREELDIIKAEIRERMQRENRRRTMATIVVTALITLLVISLLSIIF